MGGSHATTVATPVSSSYSGAACMLLVGLSVYFLNHSYCLVNNLVFSILDISPVTHCIHCVHRFSSLCTYLTGK